MLRRHPTKITLTTEDIAIYEDARAREAHLREQHLAAQAQAQDQNTPNGNGKMQNNNPNGGVHFRNPGEQQKTRAERLGLMGGSSRG